MGDSYDNAMAESVIGLYKTEVIRWRTPWMGIDDIELSTLEWVDWFNHSRLLEPIGYVPPAEFEAAYWSGVEAGVEGSVSLATATDTTVATSAALRRSEGLVWEVDSPSQGSEDGSPLLVVTGGRHGEPRREVEGSRRNVGIQAPESP